LLFGLGGAAISLTSEFRIVLGLRFVQGIGFSALIPSLIVSIGDLYEGSREATAQGLRVTSSGVAQILFPLAASYLVIVAWQLPFLLYGIAVPIGIVVWLWFDETTAVGDGAPATEGDGGLRAFIDLVSYPRVSTIMLGRSLQSIGFVGYYTYISIVVVQLLDGSSVVAGVLVAVFSFMYAATSSQTGTITNAFSGQLPPLFMAHVSILVGLAIVALAPSVLVAGIGTVIQGFGIGITLGLYRSVINNLAPVQLRGKLVGLNEALARLAITLTPIGMGAVITLLSTTMGFGGALRTTVLAAAVVSGVGGMVVLAIAYYSAWPSVSPGADAVA
jgi:MFS family permease